MRRRARRVRRSRSFTSSRTVSIRSRWNRTSRLLTSDVTHRPPSSSNANPSGKNPRPMEKTVSAVAERALRSNRKAPHPSSERLDDVQPFPRRDPAALRWCSASRPRRCAAPAASMRTTNPSATSDAPGLLARHQSRADRNPDPILLVNRDEVRRRERNPVDFDQDGAEQARAIQPPDPSVVAEVRDQKRAVGREGDPVRTQIHRRRRGAPGLVSGHPRERRSRRPAIPARRHRRTRVATTHSGRFRPVPWASSAVTGTRPFD